MPQKVVSILNPADDYAPDHRGRNGLRAPMGTPLELIERILGLIPDDSGHMEFRGSYRGEALLLWRMEVTRHADSAPQHQKAFLRGAPRKTMMHGERMSPPRWVIPGRGEEFIWQLSPEGLMYRSHDPSARPASLPCVRVKLPVVLPRRFSPKPTLARRSTPGS